MDRASDRRIFGTDRLTPHFVPGGESGVLGRPVNVQQPPRRSRLQHRLRPPAVERFSADQQAPQPAECARRLGSDLMEKRSRHEQDRHATIKYRGRQHRR